MIEEEFVISTTKCVLPNIIPFPNRKEAFLKDLRTLRLIKQKRVVKERKTREKISKKTLDILNSLNISSIELDKIYNFL